MNEVIEYESLVLGACLSEPSLIAELPLQAADFSGEHHAEIWQAMQAVRAKGLTPDLVTVSDACTAPVSLLADAMRSCYSTSLELVETWADVIRGRARKERLANGLHALATGGDDAETMLNRARELILGMDQESPSQRRGIRDAVKERLNAFADRNEGLVSPMGLTVGVKDADKMMYGLKPAELIVIAARPGAGKSALALQAAQINAVDHHKNVAFFSLEMGIDELIDRILIQRSKTPAGVFTDPRNVGDDEARSIGAQATLVSDSSLHLFDDVFDIEGIAATCQRLNQNSPLDLVVVDYLQLISTKGRANQNRAIEVGEYSRRLKMLAMQLNCPVVLLSQLNRNVETRPDKRPLMADLRESGSIEQDANKILMIYRDEIHHENSQFKGVAELILRKNRGGQTGIIAASAKLHLYTFADLIRAEVDQPREASYDPFQ